MKSDNNSSSILKKFDYELPESLIAKYPARPRDSAKLLVYIRKTDQVLFDKFYNINKYLPQNSIIVMNDTRVIPARFRLIKESGGKIEAFFIRKDYDKIIVLLNKKVLVGTRLFLDRKNIFTVIFSEGKYFYLKPDFEINSIFSVLGKKGQMPIPKYIKGSFEENKLRRDYQSVFAKKDGSVAAPTASLHFTQRLLNKLETEGFKKEFVTLHVNEGTFAPVTNQNFLLKSLHKEYYNIDKLTAKRLNAAKKNNINIIAVGTTVTRTLESACSNKQLTKLSGETDIFIQESDTLQFTDMLITNFHLPKSSLMMLVSAFIGRPKLLEVYQLAIKNKFKFYSFGDAMLIV